MPYTINKFSGEPLVVLEDGTIDTSTSLGLVGRNYVGYGETHNENFVFLLENFSNPSPPTRPVKGQTWFNQTTSALNVYDGDNWAPVGTATVSDNAPSAPTDGALWVTVSTKQLFIYQQGDWQFVGPEAAEGFGETRARSTTLLDSDNIVRPVIELVINDTIIGIISSTAFTLAPTVVIEGFSNIIAGLTLNTSTVVKGTLSGNADSATRLAAARLINGVGFNGESNITIKASTTRKLINGTYLTGNDFDGSEELTWSVDASPSNISGKVVVRNSSGGFAAGLITADLIGDVTGNVNSSTGTSNFNIVRATEFIGASLSGNAFSATKLQTGRNINGVLFNGTSDITITSDARTLTGSFLNGDVQSSNLTSLGRLTELNVNGTASFGTNNELVVAGSTASTVTASSSLSISWANQAVVQFVPKATTLSLGGADNTPAIIPTGTQGTNLGHAEYKFTKVYADQFKGVADTATLATSATNLAGGGAGSLPYQTANGATTFLSVGAPGKVLKTAGANTLVWDTLAFERLNQGNYLTFTPLTGTVDYYDTQSQITIAVDATSANTAGKVVARDSSGNFSAGTITASLVGAVSGNATSATQLQTARTINGVSFNGTANIVVEANDPTKVAVSGSTMTGYLTLVGAPAATNHAATKGYVDTRLPQYTFTYGNTVYSTSGFTNQVGSWNNGANFFDVFPPVGKSMANLMAFVPSIAVIHYSGGVDGNDSLRCTWSDLGDRIRVYVQNTEQRSTPAANYMAIWS